MTPTTVPLLFSLLSDASLTIRLATCGALNRIVAKGLKEPADKLQLIKVLSLGQVLDALETRTRGEQASRGSDVDEGEESYREALGRLLNGLGLELNKLIDVSDRWSAWVYATKQLTGIPCRGCESGRYTAFKPSSPRHATLHGGRIRRYMLHHLPFPADCPRECMCLPTVHCNDPNLALV